MAKTVIASEDKKEAETISDGQIDTIVDRLRSALRKKRGEISLQTAQHLLGVPNLGMELYSPARRIAKKIDGMFSRKVWVDRSRSPREVLEGSGFKLEYAEGDDQLIDNMPRGRGAEEVEVFFFWALGENGRPVREYKLRGLKPADPYSLIAVNRADPEFAKKYYNTTYWSTGRRDSGVMVFGYESLDHGGTLTPVVHVDNDPSWANCAWFAGVRQ